MSEKFWLEIAFCVLAVAVVIGVMKTKTTGWGPRSIQAIIVALVIPAVVVLAMEEILDTQAVGVIIGGIVGFGVGKATKD